MSNLVQFNLLPDIKLEYIKAKRTKRLLLSISIIASIASLAIAVFLFLGVNIIQKKYLNDLGKDVTTAGSKLDQVQDLNKVLTVQNQLSGLSELHSTKPSASRAFSYIAQVTPADITISDFKMEFLDNTMSFEGAAPNLLAVNRFVDTLKFTEYTNDENQVTRAFSKVTQAEYSPVDGGVTATYQITLSFDPEIFNNQKAVTLKVPETVTTRSNIDRPNVLFQSPAINTEEQ